MTGYMSRAGAFGSPPFFFHGAFNAAATLPLAVCVTNTGSLILLGPAPIGLLAGLPLIIFAVVLSTNTSIRIVKGN